MKIRRVTIEGFRGCLPRLELAPNGDSWCVLAENGFGKTTVVDALELWGSGDLRHYHREGYRLDSVINVDADRAQVELETTAHPPLRRVLVGGSPTDLQPVRPMAVGQALPPPIPLLRHRTMGEFMAMTPGEKRKALLDLTGLGALVHFRQEVKAAANAAESLQADAIRTRDAEQVLADELTGGRTFAQAADSLSVTAGLTNPILTEEALGALDLAAVERPATADHEEMVDELIRSVTALDAAATEQWNAVAEGPDAQRVLRLERLLESAEPLLADWTADSCPLCNQAIALEDLARMVAERRAATSLLRETLQQAAQRLQAYVSQLLSLADQLRRLSRNGPAGGWPDRALLGSTESAVREFASAAQNAKEKQSPLPVALEIQLPAIDAMRGAARADSQANATHRALVDLVRLQDSFGRLTQARAQVLRCQAVSEGAAAFVEHVDRESRVEVEAAIGRIGALAADFYGRLVLNPVYSDIRLQYTAERAGGIEFSVLFDARLNISPPQRVLSESQLSALGLSLFLARLRIDPQEWRTLILDDVVNSFDSNHRAGLARLLAEEFADWQVLQFTHDRMFFEMNRRVAPHWTYQQIIAWTPAGGPVFEAGDPKSQLASRLAEGRTALELGGLARAALEQALSRPIERLGLAMRYDPLARHGAKEYLDALRHGLREHRSTISDSPVLARMDAASYITNLGAHDRPADPALSQDDLRALVADLDELEATFLCGTCGQPVWTATLDGGRRHQCACAALAV